VFETCSLDTEMPTCVQRLDVMRQGGMQIVVIPAWGASLESLGAYAAAAQSLGMSVMWELSNPAWWRSSTTDTAAAGAFSAFAQACGCNHNGPLLAFTIDWLSRLGGTFGYYAADDSMLASGDQAGVASYVAQIKQQDPAHTVMIGAYGQPQASAYQGIADVIGTEIYPVTTASLMPASASQSTWDWITEDAIEAQQAADATHKQSAFILQAFTWGDNSEDGEAIGACTDGDTPQSCYDKLVYPTAGDQLQLRNEVLLNARPQLILWWSFQGTYGQAGDDSYSIYPTGANASARWSGLAAAVQAPFPTPPNAAPAPAVPARAASASPRQKRLLRSGRVTHPRRGLVHRRHRRHPGRAQPSRARR
jgi:hypothetical protein